MQSHKHPQLMSVLKLIHICLAPSTESTWLLVPIWELVLAAHQYIQWSIATRLAHAVLLSSSVKRTTRTSVMCTRQSCKATQQHRCSIKQLVTAPYDLCTSHLASRAALPAVLQSLHCSQNAVMCAIKQLVTAPQDLCGSHLVQLYLHFQL